MTPKEQLKELLNEMIAKKGMLQLSGAVFVEHEIKKNGETAVIKANTSVDDYVDRFTEEHAKEMHAMLVSLENHHYITHDEGTAVLNAWLDVGDPTDRPTNRDLVEHAKMDMELLHHLVMFVLTRERFPK